MEKNQLTEAMKAEFIRRIWDLRSMKGSMWGDFGESGNDSIRENVLAGVVKDFEFLTKLAP